MAANTIPVSQFFEGVVSEVGPALYFVPILLTVIFMPMVDFAIALEARRRR